MLILFILLYVYIHVRPSCSLSGFSSLYFFSCDTQLISEVSGAYYVLRIEQWIFEKVRLLNGEL